MRSAKVQFLIGLMLSWVSSLSYALLTNDDIILMVDSGISSEIVVLKIRSAEAANFDLSVEGLIRLKASGVDDSILKEMLERSESGLVSESSENSRLLFPGISILPAEEAIVEGSEYFIRCNFHYEKGRHVTTNYTRGAMVPVNTKVKVIKIKNDSMILSIQGQVVRIENIAKFSRRTMHQIASRMLSSKKVELSKLGEPMSGYIISGMLKLGMTKEQVLMTRGYPPGHETHSIESNRWVYWSSKFIKQTLVFEEGLLVEGRGIN